MARADARQGDCRAARRWGLVATSWREPARCGGVRDIFAVRVSRISSSWARPRGSRDMAIEQARTRASAG